MTRRCFVISPIAANNSEIREHADDVFDFIIKPAMDELGIEAYRSDHSQEIGRITEQMFNSILDDDLCIAVLTYFNPNVFYELAIAQNAARPVIILIEKGQTIPFDVRRRVRPAPSSAARQSLCSADHQSGKGARKVRLHCSGPPWKLPDTAWVQGE